MITVQLTLEQARLLRAAIVAEVNKGSGTFLSQRDTANLESAKADITTAINLSKEGLMARVEAAVEDYCDACDYSTYKSLTEEDIDYLAGELQLGTKELRELIGV